MQAFQSNFIYAIFQTINLQGKINPWQHFEVDQFHWKNVDLATLHPIGQGWGTLILEGRCPAEFSSNPNQTHLKQLIKVFRMQLGIFFPGFFRVGGKLCRRVALQDQRSPPLQQELQESDLTDHVWRVRRDDWQIMLEDLLLNRSWAHWQISYLVKLSPFTQSAQDHKIENDSEQQVQIQKRFQHPTYW